VVGAIPKVLVFLMVLVIGSTVARVLARVTSLLDRWERILSAAERETARHAAGARESDACEPGSDDATRAPAPVPGQRRPPAADMAEEGTGGPTRFLSERAIPVPHSARPPTACPECSICPYKGGYCKRSSG